MIHAVVEAPSLIFWAKRLALVLSGARRTPLQQWMIDSGDISEEAVNNIFIMLEETIPDLQELVYFVRPGPIGVTIDELYEVHEARGALLQREMDKIMTKLQEAQEKGKWKALKLKFMRCEAWEQ